VRGLTAMIATEGFFSRMLKVPRKLNSFYFRDRKRTRSWNSTEPGHSPAGILLFGSNPPCRNERPEIHFTIYIYIFKVVRTRTNTNPNDIEANAAGKRGLRVSSANGTC
jgi:hypothetical protein